MQQNLKFEFIKLWTSPLNLSRHVRWVESGGSFARNVDQIRHEFQLYDVTDTLRRRLDYNVGLSGLCFDFLNFGIFLRNWHVL